MIGAPVANAPNGCFECGAAYVYTAVNGDWTNLELTATLTQSAGQGNSGFGDAVAISGDTIVVGGYDFSTFEGAAYVYVSPSGVSTESAELTTSGSPSGTFLSVAIEGGTIVAGSPLATVGNVTELGTAYVYVEPTGGWANMTQTAQLVANDETTGCYFGTSAGISGHTVVVGAPRADENGLVQRGSAYVFREPAAGWSGTKGQAAKLEPTDGVKKAHFGSSVSISGGNVAVGAPEQSVGSNGDQGAVYVYTEPSTGWPKTMTETAELTASTGKPGSLLGDSVAISGTTLIAGAFGVRSQQGVSYVFSEPAGGWVTAAGGLAIIASDGAPNDEFGGAVGVGEGVLAVSAPGWGGVGGGGAVYVFGPAQ